jgi:flagellar hook-associated protein FlgK
VSDLLGIAGTAVTSYQLALGTVSNNIANVSTEGYSRQEVGLSSAPPRQLGGAYIGTGVVYERVKRQYDAFAELNLRNSTSELSSHEPMVDYTNRVVDLMGSENAGLVGALDQFFSAARGLTTDPASTVLRGDFFRAAQGLTSRFGLISSHLDLVDTQSREDLESSVGAINTLAQQLAAINVQLAKHGNVDKQPAELLDQRDRLLREMAEHVRVRTTFGANGSVNVSLGSTADRDLVVDGISAVRMGTYADPKNPERIGLLLDPYGEQPRALGGINSGKLAGLMSFREQVLDSSRGALDAVARALMDEVNLLHRGGVDASGQMGGDLFMVEAGARRLAGGMKLAVSDPMRIAAAAQFRVIENSENVGRADATVSYAAPVYNGPAALAQALPNNDHASAARAIAVSATTGLAGVSHIPAGLKNVSVSLNEAQGGQQLQLITRDGRHLLGSALSADQRANLLASAGMQAGASYSAQYLNISGAQGYRGMQVFYGARADVGRQQAFTGTDAIVAGQALPALLEGERIRTGVKTIAGDALQLNGIPLASRRRQPAGQGNRHLAGQRGSVPGHQRQGLQRGARACGAAQARPLPGLEQHSHRAPPGGLWIGPGPGQRHQCPERQQPGAGRNRPQRRAAADQCACFSGGGHHH